VCFPIFGPHHVLSSVRLQPVGAVLADDMRKFRNEFENFQDFQDIFKISEITMFWCAVPEMLQFLNDIENPAKNSVNSKVGRGMYLAAIANNNLYG
jgi:hypothetical protein